MVKWYTVLCSPLITTDPVFEPQTSTNTCGHICKYVDQKGSATMLTSVQSVGVTPEVNLRITQVRKHVRDPSWL